MLRFAVLSGLGFFLCLGSACKQKTVEERRLEKEEMFRDLDNQMANHWGFPRKVEPKPVPENRFDPIPKEVDIEGEENGTVRAFLFDNQICFAKEKFMHGKVRCMDLKTRRSVSIDASLIGVPEDAYFEIEANASVHVFSFQGKTCLAKNKFEKGLRKCWDPKTMENVSIDTTDAKEKE